MEGRLVRGRQGDRPDARAEELGRLELSRGRLGRVARRLRRSEPEPAGRWADPSPAIPPDCDPRTAEIVRAVAPYTLTPPERVIALCDAVRHLERRRIPGAVLECGVWRGGSMLAAALCLLDLGEPRRELCLFDTFGAVPEPGERDRHVSGVSAADFMAGALAEDPTLGQTGAAAVRELIEGAGYPPELIRTVPGLVEETIPALAPERIALCRLDTDWYASTRHELEHLYPRISPGGVLIVDDYGEFSGAREATDEYLATLPAPPLLVRIDAAARLAVIGG